MRWKLGQRDCCKAEPKDKGKEILKSAESWFYLKEHDAGHLFFHPFPSTFLLFNILFRMCTSLVLNEVGVTFYSHARQSSGLGTRLY